MGYTELCGMESVEGRSRRVLEGVDECVCVVKSVRLRMVLVPSTQDMSIPLSFSVR